MKTEKFPRPQDVVVCITNDIFGAEWTLESVARFTTFRNLWKQHGPFHIIFSAGLANADDLTIAEDMRNRFGRNAATDSKYVLPLDTESADTSTQIKNIVKIYEAYRLAALKQARSEPDLFIVSDSLHLFAISRLAHRLGVDIEPVISPLSGDWIYHLKRFWIEVIRFIWSLFDPLYDDPKITKMNQQRTAQAALKTPPAI